MLAALLYHRLENPYPRRQYNTMAKDFDYYKNLNDVIVHALLHVLMQANQSPRYIPTPKRNELLVKFLKPKLHQKALSNIKKDIKLMILTAKKKGGNLEQKLYELNAQARNFLYHDAEKLYQLLTTLSSDIHIGSKLLEGDEKRERDILYIEQDNIEKSIQPNNHENTPIIGYIQSHKVEEIVTLVNASAPFSATVKEWNKHTDEAILSIGMA